MKLLLHFGMPKAGSNAIQSVLFSNREMLLEHGILYPKSILGSPDRHHHLTIPAFEGKRLPTTFRTLSPQEASDEFKQVWANILEQVSEVQPKLVILSTEALFRRLSPAGAYQLHRCLCQISRDIVAVAYVRQLPSFFRSLVQQRILSQGLIPPLPKSKDITDALVSYEALIGRANIRLFPYEAQHDVVEDFCLLLAEYGIDRTSLVESSSRANKTLSAASMSALLSYKRSPPEDENGRPLTKFSGRLAQELKEIDKSLSLSPPVLKPCVQSNLTPEAVHLETQLRARYDMVFSEPTKIQVDEQNHIQKPLEKVRDVTYVDIREIRELYTKLKLSSWAKRHDTLTRWIDNELEALSLEN